MDRWFNTDAFAPFSPAPQAFGNAGVGIMRGPGYANFDFTLAKDFPLGGRRHFQFRTEVFNAFNRVNLGRRTSSASRAASARSFGSGNARIMQFGLKFYF